MPACLPDYNNTVGSNASSQYYGRGRTGIVSGWGLKNETSRVTATTLQYVEVPMVDQATCSQAYSSFVKIEPDLQFCAGNAAGQDSCAGDSGK